jgi:hypothetical protein
VKAEDKPNLEKKPKNQDNVQKNDTKSQGGRYFNRFLSLNYEEERFPKCGIKCRRRHGSKKSKSGEKEGSRNASHQS